MTYLTYPVYVHIHTHMYIHIRTYTYIHIHTYIFWKTPVDIHIFIMGFYNDVTNCRFSDHAEETISTCHVMVFENRWSAKLRVQANRMLHDHIFRSANLRDGLRKRMLTFPGDFSGFSPSQVNPLSANTLQC